MAEGPHNSKKRARRVAVIDCGTNTFNLRIVDIEPTSEEAGTTLYPWRNVFSLRLPVRLGKGGISKGTIRPDRIARGLDAIGIMREANRNYQVDEVYIIATSALRDASNSKVFIDGVSDRFGYSVIVISGSTEAQLIQAGIELTYTPPEGKTVLSMDIGGGSTECILWNNHEIIWSRSFDVGIARLLELFKMKDRFGEDAYEKMQPYLDDLLAPLSAAIINSKPTILVGSSGSFDAFYSLVKSPNPQIKSKLISSKDVHPQVDQINIEGFNLLAEELKNNTLRGRLNMKGMPPDRADLLPYAVAIVKWVQNVTESKLKVGFKDFYRSKYAIREGVLSRLSKGESPVPGVSID